MVSAAPLGASADGGDNLTVAESGLAWKDVTEGTGAAPTAGATIRCVPHHLVSLIGATPGIVGRRMRSSSGDGAAGRRCHYTGRLATTGAVFDSSYGRRPLTFKVRPTPAW